MAFTTTTIWEVETGGNDANNGGAFDSGQTAGMFTDGAATSATTAAPVFTSASYNFVAADVNAWLYIAAGTNWTAGWYQIASVSANAATLAAGVGAGVLAGNTAVTTAAGCATVASPTGATWTIDYSQQGTARVSYTDLASAGAGLTCSSAANPFGKQLVGNALVITAGTNFNTGRYIIASVAGTTATVLATSGNLTSGVGSGGTGGLGGALISPGMMSLWISNAAVANSTNGFIKSGTYTITTATTNVAAGCLAMPTTDGWVVGYSTNRTLINTDTKPTMIFNAGLSTATMFAGTAGRQQWFNVVFDGNAQTTSKFASVGQGQYIGCAINNFTSVMATVAVAFYRCSATGNTAGAYASTAGCFGCTATVNTATPFTIGPFVGCISYGNTGATTDGFSVSAGQLGCIGCVSYNNGRDGFALTANRPQVLINCIAEANGGFGIGDPVETFAYLVENVGLFNNTSGQYRTTFLGVAKNVIAGSSSFFTNAAGADFSLNNTTGAGAALRAAGYPGTFPSGSTTGYLDIGAVQHQDPAAPPVGKAVIIQSIGTY